MLGMLHSPVFESIYCQQPSDGVDSPSCAAGSAHDFVMEAERSPVFSDWLWSYLLCTVSAAAAPQELDATALP